MKIGIKDVLYRIWPFFIPYLVVLSACLVVKMLYTREVIYFAVNGLNSPWADYVGPYITDLGDGLAAITLSLIVALASYRKALLLASSYAVTAIAAQILKFIFDAPRPIVYFQDQWSRVHTVKGLYILHTHSFPSGHTVSVFSAGLVVTYLCKNKGWGFPALLIAILVGYSRMYLTQHFFEDVMAGSVIGVMVTVFWLTWLDGKQFIHTQTWNSGLLRTLRKK